MRYAVVLVGLVSLSLLYQIVKQPAVNQTTEPDITNFPPLKFAPKSGVGGAESTAPEEARALVADEVEIPFHPAPPPFYPGVMASRETAFATEPIDEEWSARMWREIVDSLSSYEGGISTVEVHCRSSTCRVELVSGYPVTDDTQERYQNQAQRWIREVMKSGGFHQVKSEFFFERSTTLSYFSTEEVGPNIDLGPGVPHAAVGALQDAIRARGEDAARRQAAEAENR